MMRAGLERYGYCTLVLSLLACAACSGGSSSPGGSGSGAGASQGGSTTAGGGGVSAGSGQIAGGGASGGSTPSAGTGNAEGGAATAGGTSSAGTATVGGSSGGDAGTAGSGGSAGGAAEPGYSAPPRDIMIQRTGSVTISFTPDQAAPSATNFHGGQQQARFDGSAPQVMKKLVIGLGGVGTGPHNGGGLAWAGDRGYHTLGIDYWDSSGGPDGKDYLETWSGEPVGDANVGAVNSIMNRVKTGLAYLQTKDPGADWAYFLDANGDVRWNDVIIFGYSYGAQTAAAATKYVALDRVVATSGPGISANAAWVSDMPAVTPGSRCFTISGTDDGGYDEHMATAMRFGWPGDVVETWTSSAPYGDSHLLGVQFGHSEFCSLPQNVLANADEVCEYAFGYSAK